MPMSKCLLTVYSPPNAGSSMSSRPYVKGNLTQCEIINSPAQERARQQVSPLSRFSNAFALLRLGRNSAGALPPPSFPAHPGPSTSIDSNPEGPLAAENHASRWIGERFKKLSLRRRRTTSFAQLQMMPIDVLPDDILVEIFYFYVGEAQSTQAWRSLVHVCRRWRWVVFGSPRLLNLQLVCTAKTPARESLDVWPPLPLLIQVVRHLEEGFDNVIAVLERSDRVRLISLAYVPSLYLEKLSTAMQVPFPELTNLELWSHGEVALLDSFLGGSAPRLQILRLVRIPFPGLPKLLLSATHLVELRLENIPHSGYISPEVMATALSSLTTLKSFRVEFESPLSRPDHDARHPFPQTHAVLLALTHVVFRGDSEYFDDLVALIDAPQLKELYITFFNQIVFDAPQLIRFICRTPKLKTLEKAHVSFDVGAARVRFSSLTSGYELLHVEVLCGVLDWQVSSLEQVCSSCLPPLSTLEDLYINKGRYLQPHLQDNIENGLWLELLHPFSAVKNLYLSVEFAHRIVPALQDLVGTGATEVLPTVHNIFLEGLQPSGPIQEAIGKFVATRQVTSHPITVSRWYL